MILDFLLQLFLYLLMLFVSTLLIVIITMILHTPVTFTKNKGFETFYILLVSIIQLLVGLYLHFYLVTKMSKYFYSKYEYLPFYIIIILILGFSQLRFINKELLRRQRQKTIEQMDRSNINFTEKSLMYEINNKTPFSEVMRNTVFGLTINIGTMISLVFFILYYFNKNIFDWAINFIF